MLVKIAYIFRLGALGSDVYTHVFRVKRKRAGAPCTHRNNRLAATGTARQKARMQPEGSAAKFTILLVHELKQSYDELLGFTMPGGTAQKMR